jgi:hypothetical protein
MCFQLSIFKHYLNYCYEDLGIAAFSLERNLNLSKKLTTSFFGVSQTGRQFSPENLVDFHQTTLHYAPADSNY